MDVKISETEVLKAMDQDGWITDKRVKKSRYWLQACETVIWKMYFDGVQFDDWDFYEDEESCKLARRCAGRY